MHRSPDLQIVTKITIPLLLASAVAGRIGDFVMFRSDALASKLAQAEAGASAAGPRSNPRTVSSPPYGPPEEVAVGAGPDIDHGRPARAIARPLPETPGLPVSATGRAEVARSTPVRPVVRRG